MSKQLDFHDNYYLRGKTLSTLVLDTYKYIGGSVVDMRQMSPG